MRAWWPDAGCRPPSLLLGILGGLFLASLPVESSKKATWRFPNHTGNAIQPQHGPTTTSTCSRNLRALQEEEEEEEPQLDFPHTGAIDFVKNTPAELAQIWEDNDPNLGSYSDDRRAQRNALVNLYYSTDGDNWFENTNWLSYDVPECEWYSRFTSWAVCDGDGTYVALALYENNLAGTLPAHMAALSALTWVNLRENRIGGEIPSEIGSIANLVSLNLASNMLGGEFPAELAKLGKLDHLSLNDNFLDGPIAAASELMR